MKRSKTRSSVKGRETSSTRRHLPSMERLLREASVLPLIEEFGRERVKSELTSVLNTLRASGDSYVAGDAIATVHDRLTGRRRELTSIRRVINGAGVVIHTNLGRSPIDPALWNAAGIPISRYSNLEFDLQSGERGSRDDHLSEVARELFGCEAALLTNNNAAAVLLLLAALGRGKEVIVSRGELVEIGGSFRVPDVIQQGGAKLREVGSTNRTRARDYQEAVSRKTAAILSVHRSNFEIVGFTETPSVEELVEVATRKKVPLLIDEGSGRLIDLQQYGLRREPTVQQLLRAGADVVTCSTDKLIGATQGGLILGSKALVERCRRHPLMRAVRAGKESYAVVTLTLLAFLSGRHESLLPIYRMMAATKADLRRRAEAIVSESGGVVVETESAVGGGTTPAETIPSIAIEIPGSADRIAATFLALEIPVVGRIRNDRFGIDLRTVFPDEDPLVIEAIRASIPS